MNAATIAAAERTLLQLALIGFAVTIGGELIGRMRGNVQ